MTDIAAMLILSLALICAVPSNAHFAMAAPTAYVWSHLFKFRVFFYLMA